PAYRVNHAEGLKITTTKDGASILLTGGDIPAFITEPWMPPLDEIQPAAIFYYIDRSKDTKTFWSDEGRRLETQATDFFGQDETPIHEAIEEMKIPQDADLDAKIKAAYTWILDNIKNLSLRTREELDADARGDKKTN